MKFSFLSSGNFVESSLTALSNQLMNVRFALVHLSQMVRFDPSSMSKDDPRDIISHLQVEAHEERDQLIRHGGNALFYDMVKGIVAGELFPINRTVYENNKEEITKRQDYLSLLFVNTSNDNGIYVNTIEGRRWVGSTIDNPLFTERDGKESLLWPIVFDKNKPEEIKGEFATTLTRVGNAELGFDRYCLSSDTLRYYSTSSSFSGLATLELGCPEIHVGDVNSQYINNEAINKIIFGDYVTPTLDEIKIATSDVLERFRQWINTAPIDDAKKAVDVFNKYSSTSLLRIDGYLVKAKEGEEQKSAEEVYSYRIATTKNLEHRSYMDYLHGNDEVTAYVSKFTDPLSPEFILPLFGPTEDNPEYHKVNRVFYRVNLIRLVSGLQDFLKDPKGHLDSISGWH